MSAQNEQKSKSQKRTSSFVPSDYPSRTSAADSSEYSFVNPSQTKKKRAPSGGIAYPFEEEEYSRTPSASPNFSEASKSTYFSPHQWEKLLSAASPRSTNTYEDKDDQSLLSQQEHMEWLKRKTKFPEYAKPTIKPTTRNVPGPTWNPSSTPPYPYPKSSAYVPSAPEPYYKRSSAPYPGPTEPIPRSSAPFAGPAKKPNPRSSVPYPPAATSFPEPAAAKPTVTKPAVFKPALTYPEILAGRARSIGSPSKWLKGGLTSDEITTIYQWISDIRISNSTRDERIRLLTGLDVNIKRDFQLLLLSFHPDKIRIPTPFISFFNSYRETKAFGGKRNRHSSYRRK